jgi:hypothetical protein
METVKSNACMRAAVAQEFVGRWRAVSTNDVDLSSGIAN